jgi:predicted site-specific integrase-resolvase
MEQKRYKLTAAARLLGISPWTLRRWMYAGKVPAIKSHTGRVFIPAWWIDAQSGAQPQGDTVCPDNVPQSPPPALD